MTSTVWVRRVERRMGDPRLGAAGLPITAATDGRAGVRDLLRRTLRWRVGIGWYMLAIPVGALLLAPLFLGPAPLQGFLQNWPLLFTDFVPQLLLGLVTMQFFEEGVGPGLCSTDSNLAPRR
ncbi:MAG TPA: hypothetical protein VF086_09480 [Propionibacteriaceae bacterium]